MRLTAGQTDQHRTPVSIDEGTRASDRAGRIGSDLMGFVDQGNASQHARQNNKIEGAERKGKYALFRRHCDGLKLECDTVHGFLVDGLVIEEGLECIVEIEAMLERLYGCDWGEGESLKRVVVRIQSQLLNAVWTTRHVEFLKDALRLLRTRYLINDDVVDEIFDLISVHELDSFRGSVSDSTFKKRYRMVEEKDQ